MLICISISAPESRFKLQEFVHTFPDYVLKMSYESFYVLEYWINLFNGYFVSFSLFQWTSNE